MKHQHTVTLAFLALLDRDIQAGVNVRPLPEDLAQRIVAQAQLHHDVPLDEALEGDIDL